MTKKNSHSIIKIDTYHKFSVSDAGSFSDNYKGLPIHAQNGLHGFVAEKVGQFIVPGESILDLGAGSGAMSQRMVDMGMDVTAMDLENENFRLKNMITFISADLNEIFSNKLHSQFGGIIAVEIIEHLENPRNFLRECYKLLKADGYLILTTPNIDNPVAKGMFLKSGTFQWFTDYNYEYDGHILPVSQWLLRKITQEAGFTIEWIGTYGDPLGVASSLLRKTLARVIQFFSSCESDMAGEITVVVLKK